MIIANDPQRREHIHSAPDTPVPLAYITNDLWPKLGFLPIDPENPGVALIAVPLSTLPKLHGSGAWGIPGIR